MSHKLHIERLKELDMYKDKLLANVSHDLRSPISGIIGLVED
jgi:signal transduction histidine kinase